VTQKEYTGSGSIWRLSQVLGELGARSVLLVTGRQSYSACGAEERLGRILDGYEVRRFCDFSTNPKVEDVDRGIGLLVSERFDVVLAVGGGSTIDMAKLINFLSVHPQRLAGYKFSNRPGRQSLRPLIAIPTTSGSGSEATSFAVVYVGKEKVSVEDESLLPDVVIVDWSLTESLPAAVTAASGLDALSQAVESYWSIRSNDESKRYAAAAVEAVIANLEAAVNRPTASVRAEMSRAANLAGKAINITRTTACHAVSYPLTSHFGIAHGHAVGLLLSPLLAFNAEVTDRDVLDQRGAEYVRGAIDDICGLLGAKAALDAARRIDSLIGKTGLPTRLSDAGLKSKDDLEIIVAEGFNPARVRNNPRLLTTSALREILERIY